MEERRTNLSYHCNCQKCQRRLRVNNTFRSLWEQHSFWTYNFIASTIHKLPDASFVAARLLRNPEDFGAELSHFYTKQEAYEFTKLLKEHLMIAGEWLNAVMVNNVRDAERQKRRWYQNAEEIAKYLSSINPFWCRKAWTDMFFEHLAFVESLADLRLCGDYAETIKVFDKMEKQALMMADNMTEGILKQF